MIKPGFAIQFCQSTDVQLSGILNDVMPTPEPKRGDRLGLVWLLLATILVLTLLSGCGRDPVTPLSTAQLWQEQAGEISLDQLNVILISIDTLRADRLSSYGSTRVETPHIDRLAREGVRFSNAASTVPFTLPAHSSIMTGTYPPFHGVRENVGYFLDDSLATIAGQLSEHGWTTGGFVSAFVLDSRWGIAKGFDTYFDDFDPEETSKGNLGSVQRQGPETIAAAVDWLDSDPGSPFFLWLHLYDPHDPYTPPEPFKSQYRNPYDAEVAYTDALIGEFRQALEKRGLLETSLVILTSDHGEGLGQHQEGFHGFFIYDSTVRVPLIIRAPFGGMAGKVVDEAVSHVDLFPTILEAVGLSAPPQAQGTSLLAAALGLAQDDAPERLVYTESLYPLLHYGWAPLRSLRSRDFKFIDAPEPELYDLSGDPEESQNALLAQRRTSRQLKDALDAMTARIKIGGVVSEGTDIDERTMRQLQALGYVAGRGGVDLEDVADHDRADPKDRIRLHQLVMAAQSDIGAEDFEKAAAKLHEALATDGSLLDAHHMLGTVAMQKEEFESAAEYFQSALAEKIDHTPSILGLANAYLRLERKEEALVGFQRVLEIDSTDSNAALGAADILVEQERGQEAASILEAALDQERPAPILFSRLGELVVEQGDSQRAATLFRQAIAGNDQLAPAHFNLAVILEEAGHADEAMTHYQQTIELAPAHYQALFNLGRLYGRRQQLDRQQELYESAIEANPAFYRGYFFLAKLIMDRGGDLQRAEKLTRQALTEDTEHRSGPLGYYVLADILNRQGRGPEAREAARKGQEIQAQGG